MDQICAAANGGLHLIAIGMAVSLPAICASLAAESGYSGGKEYKDWCSTNLQGDSFTAVTPADLYSMRCGVLHQGRFGDLKHGVERVIFVPPDGLGNVFVNGMVNDAYFYSVVEFCQNMCDAVRVWYWQHKAEPVVIANLSRMMQYHPNGLNPYATGMELIA